jgi:hypothetical protein
MEVRTGQCITTEDVRKKPRYLYNKRPRIKPVGSHATEGTCWCSLVVNVVVLVLIGGTEVVEERPPEQDAGIVKSST